MKRELKLPEPPKLVTVTVDGEELQLPEGKNLLQALLDVGIYVPHYCYHPKLKVAGNCRLCLVEIEGRSKPEISCNMVVKDGLKIRVNSELADDCRKGMIEFLLVNHPLDCPICDRGGECMLQRYSMDYGWGTARTTDQRRRFPKPQFDPLIDIERNRCIMCTRCVRFCEDVGGEHSLSVFARGYRNYIGTWGDGPVANMFSGNVIDICPVGCLTSKPFRFNARPWELRQTMTTTRTCTGPITAWTRGGYLHRVTPPARKRNGLFTIDENTPIFISNEARFGTYYANSKDRLLEPLMRDGDGNLKPVSWDVALDTAERVLGEARDGQACILAGERSTNEEAYLLGRLARSALRTPYIDWRSRFLTEEAARAAGSALAASDGDLDLLEQGAYEATLMIAADPLNTVPDSALRLKEAARNGLTRLGLLDARICDWFAPHAETAYLERPEDLAPAMTKLAEALEQGRSTENAPEGFESLFKLIAESEQGLVVLGLDYTGGLLNPSLVPAALRLVRALGDGWRFLPMTGARNARGAFHGGAQSDRLPGGALDNEAIRNKTAELWDLSTEALPSPEEAPTAPRLLEMAAEGRFKALVLHRTDELVTHPRRALVEKAIEATPTVILIDVFPSWISERADLVLPGSMFFETDGSMTDMDGRILRMKRGNRPAGLADEEWRIIESLRLRLEGGPAHRDIQEVFGEMCLGWGMSEPLRLRDFTWEGPGDETPAWHHVFRTRKRRPAFKLHATARPEPPDPSSIALQPGSAPHRLRLVWIHHLQGPDHLGTRSSEYDAMRPRPLIELNPEDAHRLGLGDGAWVKLKGGSREPSRVALREYVAPGIAYGAGNVLGLTASVVQDGHLPEIELEKVESPAAETTLETQPEA